MALDQYKIECDQGNDSVVDLDLWSRLLLTWISDLGCCWFRFHVVGFGVWWGLGRGSVATWWLQHELDRGSWFVEEEHNGVMDDVDSDGEQRHLPPETPQSLSSPMSQSFALASTIRITVQCRHPSPWLRIYVECWGLECEFGETKSWMLRRMRVFVRFFFLNDLRFVFLKKNWNMFWKIKVERKEGREGASATT